jgi:hypothetical protein
MWCDGKRQYLPILVFSSLTSASLAGLLLLPAVPQDQSYHLFADCRTVAGIAAALGFKLQEPSRNR